MDAFLSGLISLRSSLFGLHFSQDLPSLWAATQHLYLAHFAFGGGLFTTSLRFLGFIGGPRPCRPAAREHPRTTSVFINFIIFQRVASAKRPSRGIGLGDGLDRIHYSDAAGRAEIMEKSEFRFSQEHEGRSGLGGGLFGHLPQEPCGQDHQHQHRAQRADDGGADGQVHAWR